MMYADGVAGEKKFLSVINLNTSVSAAADVATVALQRKNVSAIHLQATFHQI